VIRLRLPALRERREDVYALTRHFLQQSAKQLGVDPKRISDAALAQLSTFNFPGNVRQLENICHWLTVMAPAQLIEPKDLPPEVIAGAPVEGPVSVPHAPAMPLVPAVASVLVESEPLAEGPATSTGTAAAAPAVGESVPASAAAAAEAWETGLEHEAQALLAAGRHDVWDALSRRFESRLILTALASTRGRRIEAAQKLGIGRNTITRKIQELGIE
jgi:two-component system nitrogen regulation response regulator GlnG